MFAASLAAVGCINEYHPEYHPVSSYTVTQNVSYSTTVIQNVLEPASARPPDTKRASPATLPATQAVAQSRLAEPAQAASSSGHALTSEHARYAASRDKPALTHILAPISLEDLDRLDFWKRWPADSRDAEIHPESQPAREIRGFHASVYRDPDDRSHGVLELYTREPMSVGSMVLVTREGGDGDKPLLAYGRVVDDS